jgi:NADH pyrophosphatase NudC (nudix superfamily)
MPIKGEQQGYTYKALIDGVWQEVTIQESPLELVERFEQDEEWTRVRHGHWINHIDDLFPEDSSVECSVCHEYEGIMANDNYCPNCGARMDEVENV